MNTNITNMNDFIKIVGQILAALRIKGFTSRDIVKIVLHTPNLFSPIHQNLILYILCNMGHFLIIMIFYGLRVVHTASEGREDPYH